MKRRRRLPAALENALVGLAVLASLPWAAGLATRIPRPHLNRKNRKAHR